METKIEIPFEQLMQYISQLPLAKKLKLKKAIDVSSAQLKSNDKSMSAFQELLLNGPVLSKKQIIAIEEARTKINKWRKG